jgi:hypothetical protein
MIRRFIHWWRSSVTGRFVSRAYAKEHPDTTEEQKRPMRDDSL